MNINLTDFIYVDSPVGTITLAASGGELAQACYGKLDMPCKMAESAVLHMAAVQFEEYFALERTEFSLPLCLGGSAFEQRVWRALLTIPYGETRSYGDVAMMTGSPRAARAVGNACNKNPIALVIPCHRVTAAHGIGGFGAHMEIKKYLLNLEKSKKSY